MSDACDQIAGVPVVELGSAVRHADLRLRRRGDPRQIADLARFDVVRYAQKACSNLAVLDLVRRPGRWSIAVEKSRR